MICAHSGRLLEQLARRFRQRLDNPFALGFGFGAPAPVAPAPAGRPRHVPDVRVWADKKAQAKRRQVRRKLFCVLAEHTPSRDCGCANRGTSVVRVVKMRVRSYHLHVQSCVRQNCFPRKGGLRSCIAAFPGCVRRDTLRCRVGNRALSVGRAPHVQTRRRDVSTLTRNRRGYATLQQFAFRSWCSGQLAICCCCCCCCC